MAIEREIRPGDRIVKKKTGELFEAVVDGPKIELWPLKNKGTQEGYNSDKPAKITLANIKLPKQEKPNQ
jgi:hypothetical protein